MAQPVKCASEVSEEEEDERVKCAGGDKSSLALPLWISCFLFIVLSYEDNKALTFDSAGTEAHPATDAILFQCLVTPHHMTSVTRQLPTFQQFVSQSGEKCTVMTK